MPRHAPCSNGTSTERGTACAPGTTTYSAAVPNGRYRCAPKHHTRSPIRESGTPSPTASIVPAPSLCGTTLGKGIPTLKTSWRFLTSPGLMPEAAIRMRTSPGSGRGSGISPTTSTSAAGPCFSYHAAFIPGGLYSECLRESKFSSKRTPLFAPSGRGRLSEAAREGCTWCHGFSAEGVSLEPR